MSGMHILKKHWSFQTSFQKAQQKKQCEKYIAKFSNNHFQGLSENTFIVGR
jgi:hypothetical protein